VVPDRVLGIELPPFDPLNQRAAALRREGHHVICLGQARPFFTPPPSALIAARHALDTADVHRYSTDPGLLTFRTILAARLSATTGAAIVADDLVITAGANHAFTLAMMTLVDPGSEVVLPSPYFTNHQMAVCALGGVPVEAPVADRRTFMVRWTDIAPHLSPRTRAVVLCTPSNPTGATIDRREGALIAAELGRRGIVLVSDETYMSFVYEGSHWSAAAVSGWREHVVVAGTFSKSFGMMGWRVGYLLADAHVCAQAIKIQDATMICAPVISQMAAEGAARDDWAYAGSFRADLLERRRVMIEGLDRIPSLQWTPAPGGLFAFVRVDGETDSATLSGRLLEEAHVVSIPGAAFGRAGEGYLRLSYGYATPADIADAMERLRRFFHERSG
jgi:aminotransferase